jgi:hypothetical protein
MSRIRFAVLFAIALPALGCQKGPPPRVTGNVSGTVALGDAPLAAGVVILEDAKRGLSCSAVVADGKFEFVDPVDIGEFRIAIHPPPQPPPHEMPATPLPAGPVIPERYVTADKSGLTVTVREGKNELPLRLDRSKSR